MTWDTDKEEKKGIAAFQQKSELGVCASASEHRKGRDEIHTHWQISAYPLAFLSTEAWGSGTSPRCVQCAWILWLVILRHRHRYYLLASSGYGDEQRISV